MGIHHSACKRRQNDRTIRAAVADIGMRASVDVRSSASIVFHTDRLTGCDRRRRAADTSHCPHRLEDARRSPDGIGDGIYFVQPRGRILPSVEFEWSFICAMLTLGKVVLRHRSGLQCVRLAHSIISFDK